MSQGFLLSNEARKEVIAAIRAEDPKPKRLDALLEGYEKVVSPDDFKKVLFGVFIISCSLGRKIKLIRHMVERWQVDPATPFSYLGATNPGLRDMTGLDFARQAGSRPEIKYLQSLAPKRPIELNNIKLDFGNGALKESDEEENETTYWNGLGGKRRRTRRRSTRKSRRRASRKSRR
jgi:hypothetical protein